MITEGDRLRISQQRQKSADSGLNDTGRWLWYFLGAIFAIGVITWLAVVTTVKHTKASVVPPPADAITADDQLLLIKSQLGVIQNQVRANGLALSQLTAAQPTTPSPITNDTGEAYALRYDVTKDHSNVRSGPSTSNTIVATLDAGQSVVVTGKDQESGWYTVSGTITDTAAGVSVKQWPGGVIGYMGPGAGLVIK